MKGEIKMGKQKKYNGYLRTTFTHNNKRYYIYGKTQQELLENLNIRKQELEQGELNLYNPTLSDYYKKFTDTRREEVGESTLRAQKYQFEGIASILMVNDRPFGEMRIKDITRRDIEEVRQTMLDQGKTPENLNICFSHLNHVFNNAVMDDTLVKNPCKALKPLKRKTAPIGETKHRALTIEETKRFFEVAEERNSYYINVFKMMMLSGMRIGEVTALYLTDIDRKNNYIHVRKTITRDEVGNYIVGDSAKTKSGIRDIPLTIDLIKVIKDQEELNRIVFGFDWSGLLFQSVEGEILREYQINREIKRICKEAEIDYFTCHAFRNTFATRFIEQRPQDYKILSELLGHNDIAITLNLYTHVMNDNKVTAMRELSIKIS